MNPIVNLLLRLVMRRVPRGSRARTGRMVRQMRLLNRLLGRRG